MSPRSILIAAVLLASGAPPDLKVKLGETAPAIPPSGVQKMVILSDAKPETFEVQSKQLAAMGTKLILLNGADKARFSNSGAWALLIDRDGNLRRAEPATADLIAMVRRWEAGKAIFSVACTRCHGEDGNSADFYAYNIRPLGGIGNRLSESEIRERLHPLKTTGDQYSVRAYLLSEEELRSLVIYVAGL